MKRTAVGFLILALSGGSGCAALHHEVHSSAPVAASFSTSRAGQGQVENLPPQCGNQRGVIFIVDGAGGFQGTSSALMHELQSAHLPLGVVPIEWTHGFGRVFADQVDWRHARESGCKLAGQILAYRQSFPQGKIYVVAHSAGSAVAIAATESLPPCSIDRVVLLAPSISTDHDLRPALSCVRESMDVFFSSRDMFQLGLGIALVGTADGCWGCTAAGRTGFQPQVTYPEDALLYAKLRQHPWNPYVEWTGHHGGHYGVYQPEFLKAYVLPLLDDRTPLEAVSNPGSADIFPAN